MQLVQQQQSQQISRGVHGPDGPVFRGAKCPRAEHDHEQDQIFRGFLGPVIDWVASKPGTPASVGPGARSVSSSGGGQHARENRVRMSSEVQCRRKGVMSDQSACRRRREESFRRAPLKALRRGTELNRKGREGRDVGPPKKGNPNSSHEGTKLTKLSEGDR